MQIIFFLGVSPGLTILLPRSVLSADIQDPNSNAIATQYCNSNLSREMRSNMFQPLAVPRLKNPVAWSPQYANYWCGLLDCFSQRKRRLTTASQAVCNKPRGETARRQDKDNVESFSSSGSAMRLPVSTTVLVQRTPLVYSILFRCKCSQTHWHSYQAIFFSNLKISIKHRQIGEQSVRFGLHKKIQHNSGM